MHTVRNHLKVSGTMVRRQTYFRLVLCCSICWLDVCFSKIVMTCFYCRVLSQIILCACITASPFQAALNSDWYFDKLVTNQHTLFWSAHSKTQVYSEAAKDLLVCNRWNKSICWHILVWLSIRVSVHRVILFHRIRCYHLTRTNESVWKEFVIIHGSKNQSFRMCDGFVECWLWSS